MYTLCAACASRDDVLVICPFGKNKKSRSHPLPSPFFRIILNLPIHLRVSRRMLATNTPANRMAELLSSFGDNIHNFQFYAWLKSGADDRITFQAEAYLNTLGTVKQELGWPKAPGRLSVPNLPDKPFPWLNQPAPPQGPPGYPHQTAPPPGPPGYPRPTRGGGGKDSPFSVGSSPIGPPGSPARPCASISGSTPLNSPP
jgi:hypothetical protein